MRKFDYSFLNNGMLPASFVNLTSGIAELKTMAGGRKEEYTQIFAALEAVAKVQSIESSNAIEGIVTGDERIAAIENFLSTLYMCYRELDKRFAVVHGKKITKKARVEATVLNSLTPLSKADICKILPDVSPTTVEAVLGEMVKTGSVKRIGAGRATRYIRAD